jgi:hypothetical protein
MSIFQNQKALKIETQIFAAFCLRLKAPFEILDFSTFYEVINKSVKGKNNGLSIIRRAANAPGYGQKNQRK